MIDMNLTPNELAKYELYDKMETAFYDGVKGTHHAEDITDREEGEVNRHCNKHMATLYKQWGMAKIFRKMGYDR